ncbi:MAG: hypothetical protein MJ168_05410 [Clostridia bacterium]|nr:hypothetical protein [Clostridia bacterium]
MGDTPLGYVVSLRSEKDPERINNFTAEEKRIVCEWKEFRMSQNGGKQQITMSWKELQSALKSLAGGG